MGLLLQVRPQVAPPEGGAQGVRGHEAPRLARPDAIRQQGQAQQAGITLRPGSETVEKSTGLQQEEAVEPHPQEGQGLV